MFKSTAEYFSIDRLSLCCRELLWDTFTRLQCCRCC